MPAVRNLPAIWRGDPYAHVIAFGNVGTWVDVSDYEFEAEVRYDRKGQVLATFSIDQPTVDQDLEIEGVEVTVPKESCIVLRLTDTVTADLEQSVVQWDLQETAPTKVTVLAGTIPVEGDITR